MGGGDPNHTNVGARFPIYLSLWHIAANTISVIGFAKLAETHVAGTMILLDAKRATRSNRVELARPPHKQPTLEEKSPCSD